MLNSIALVGEVTRGWEQIPGSSNYKFELMTSEPKQDGSGLHKTWHKITVFNGDRVTDKPQVGDVVALRGRMSYRTPKEKVAGMPGGLVWPSVATFPSDMAIVAGGEEDDGYGGQTASPDDDLPF